jgi:hypothetical protein
MKNILMALCALFIITTALAGKKKGSIVIGAGNACDGLGICATKPVASQLLSVTYNYEEAKQVFRIEFTEADIAKQSAKHDLLINAKTFPMPMSLPLPLDITEGIGLPAGFTVAKGIYALEHIGTNYAIIIPVK